MRSSGHAMCLAWGPDRTFLYNDAYAPILGERHPEAMGLPIVDVWPDVWSQIEPLVERALAGETLTFQDMPLTMTRHGYPEETWWSFSYSPVRDETGRVAGLLNVTSETTRHIIAERQRDQAIEQQRLLNGELAHRLRNMIGVVQAIAFQTLGATSDQAAVAQFGERLKALAAAHDVLTQRSWSDAPLREVAEGALATFSQGDRITLAGPDLHIGSRATLALSLLLHELATNATKYGALSGERGNVTLIWEVAGEPDNARVVMHWLERGGPPAIAPARRGFGSRIIRMGLTGSGGVDVSYGEQGLTVRMETPLSQLQQT